MKLAPNAPVYVVSGATIGQRDPVTGAITNVRPLTQRAYLIVDFAANVPEFDVFDLADLDYTFTAIYAPDYSTTACRRRLVYAKSDVAWKPRARRCLR